MTTADKLNKVIESKENIKDAIEAKGVTVGSAPLSQYAEKIMEIQTEDPNLFPEESGSTVETYSMKYTQNDGNPKLNIYSKSGRLGELYNLGASIGVGTGQSQDFRGITEITLVNIKELNGTFNEMVALRTINGLQEVESITNYAFAYANQLILSADEYTFPNVRYIGQNAFQNYNPMPNFIFPKVKTIEAETGIGTRGLKNSLTLGSPGEPVGSINAMAFNNSGTTQINVYVNDPTNPGLPGAPWGAASANITYLQA